MAVKRQIKCEACSKAHTGAGSWCKACLQASRTATYSPVASAPIPAGRVSTGELLSAMRAMTERGARLCDVAVIAANLRVTPAAVLAAAEPLRGLVLVASAYEGARGLNAAQIAVKAAKGQRPGDEIGFLAFSGE